MNKKLRVFPGLLFMAILGWQLSSCDIDEAPSDTYLEHAYNKSLVAGPFVWKMNIEGKCPKKGNGCSKTRREALAPESLGALDYAVVNGANGIKDFFLSGPWNDVFPGLEIHQRDIYQDMISGNISAIALTRSNTTTYCFGPGVVTFGNAKYHFIVE